VKQQLRASAAAVAPVEADLTAPSKPFTPPQSTRPPNDPPLSAADQTAADELRQRQQRGQLARHARDRERPITIPIETLGLLAYARNRLVADGIKTVADLTKKSGAELLRLPGFGPASLREVETALARLGFSLGQRAKKLDRFLTWADLFDRGVISSKTQARRLWESGKFPAPVHLSQRVIAFRESEIDVWAAARIAQQEEA
jgi:predicted DNA-binding transcriptional regulator AlpA